MKKFIILILILFYGCNFYAQSAQSYYSAAVIKMVNKKYNEALSDFNKAIKINKKFADAYFNRGIVYEKKGEYNKAIADYTKVISLKPNMYQAYNNRGLLYFGISDYKRAISDFTASIRIKNDFAFTYLYRSNTYLVMGNMNMAQKDAEKVLEFLPNYFKAHQILAQILFLQNNYQESLKHYNFLCTSQPGEASNFLGRARVYNALNLNSKACADYEKAKELGSNNAAEEMKGLCNQ